MKMKLPGKRKRLKPKRSFDVVRGDMLAEDAKDRK